MRADNKMNCAIKEFQLVTSISSVCFSEVSCILLSYHSCSYIILKQKTEHRQKVNSIRKTVKPAIKTGSFLSVWQVLNFASKIDSM